MERSLYLMINTRKQLESDLLELKRKMMQLGKMSEDAITRAVWALKNKDAAVARTVIDGDDAIDEFSDQIDSECMNFAARYQPLGQDLRTIQAMTHIAVDFERIADYGVNIARVAIQMNGKEWIKPLIDIPRMVEIISEMISKALTALDICDKEFVLQVFKLDETVDDIEKQIVRELFLLVMEKPSRIEQSFMLMSIARALERAGDHVTNVAERIYYICTGKKTKASDYKRPRQ
jgi:phosphate transport system protein